jgi:hypothetical protein
MEGATQRTIRQVLKDRTPDLYRRLERSGELEHFIYYKSAAVSAAVDHLRYQEQWDFLPHLEMVQRLNRARADFTAALLADMSEDYQAA